MFSHDRARFLEIMTCLSAMYGSPLSESSLSLWWAVMKAFTIEDVESAATRHLKDTDHGTFMAKPADLIRLIEGTSKGASALAWMKVTEAVTRRGPWASVTFDDPLINKVISDLGGWPWICEQTAAEWPFLGSRFENIYRELKTIGASGLTHPSHLIGLEEAHNRVLGHRPPPPIPIGSVEAARLVFSSGARPGSALAEARKADLQLASSISVESLVAKTSSENPKPSV